MLEQELDTLLLDQMNIPADELHVFRHQEDELIKMMMIYNCAIRRVKTKFQVLNDELSITRQRNPIEFIKSRIKQPKSISSKLKSLIYAIKQIFARTSVNENMYAIT